MSTVDTSLVLLPSWSVTGLVVDGRELWAVEVDDVTRTYTVDGTELSAEETKSWSKVPD